MIFNVFRQLELDLSTSTFWDVPFSPRRRLGDKSVHVGLIRARATIWIGKDPRHHIDQRFDKDQDDLDNIGVLLLDPTIREGNPLWRRTRNWAKEPPMTPPRAISPRRPPPSDNMFEDFLYWATRPEDFEFYGATADIFLSPVDFTKSVVLHLVCTEWLTLLDYLHTRLNQINWEISQPGWYHSTELQTRLAASKLQRWRYQLPMFHHMLNETIRHMFEQTGKRRHQSDQGPDLDSSGGASICNLLQNYRKDFSLVQSRLWEMQERINYEIKALNAATAVQQSRYRLSRSKALSWLACLAVLWFPLVYVGNMLSMTTTPLSELGGSMTIWTAVSLPALLVIVSAHIMYIRAC